MCVFENVFVCVSVCVSVFVGVCLGVCVWKFDCVCVYLVISLQITFQLKTQTNHCTMTKLFLFCYLCLKKYLHIFIKNWFDFFCNFLDFSVIVFNQIIVYWISRNSDPDIRSTSFETFCGSEHRGHRGQSWKKITMGNSLRKNGNRDRDRNRDLNRDKDRQQYENTSEDTSSTMV